MKGKPVVDIDPIIEVLGPYDLSKLEDKAYRDKIVKRINSIIGNRTAMCAYEGDDFVKNQFRIYLQPKKKHFIPRQFFRLFDYLSNK